MKSSDNDVFIHFWTSIICKIARCPDIENHEILSLLLFSANIIDYCNILAKSEYISTLFQSL